MTDTINPELTMSLEEAVGEVLVLLTGQDLSYDSQYDRFRVITKHLNRALRTNALELEWSYYSEQLSLGPVMQGDQVFPITTDWRFRVINDDAVRLVNDEGIPIKWAHFLPRDALHKYRNRDGLWASTTRNQVLFSRPMWKSEEGLSVELPVMREPDMFRLPDAPYDTQEVIDPENPDEPDFETIYPTDILTQPVDFYIPDLITARAAWLYAQTDPVMQPRVQTLEAQMDDLKYQAMERDMAFNESPYLNEFIVPVQNGIYGESAHRPWPVSNRR